MKTIASLVAVIFLFLQVPTIQGAIEEYNIVFNLQADKSVSEVFEIAVSESEQEYTFTITGDFSELKVSDGRNPIPFRVETNAFTMVRISPPEETKTIMISFAKRDLIFQNNGVYQFFTSINIPPSEKTTVKVILPPGHVLHSNIISPEGAVIGSDGERISFTWTFMGEVGNFPVSVQFTSLYKDSLTIWILPIISAISILLIYLYFRGKRKKDFLMQFYEDERKVIEDLMELKQSYQNTLERKHAFSRSKMTRFIQKLEKRGLVRTEKAGRTKRIYWKRK